MKPDLPTLTDQRAADLDVGDDGVDMSEAIYAAIRAMNTALKVDRTTTRQPPPRTLPTGVYRHHGALVASFSRRVDGKQRTIHVDSGSPGDFSAVSADRLARECRAAKRAWDAERRSHD
jgi:hypothetical protein